VESELWPNTLSCIKKQRIPLILLNARLSDKSYARWRKISWLARWMLAHFDLCLAQNEETLKRLQSLGCVHAERMTNLKVCTPPLAIDDAVYHHFSSLLTHRTVWMCTSTHKGEDDIMLDIHTRLKRTLSSSPFILIAPRHPHRTDDVCALARERSLHVIKLSDALKHDGISFNHYDGLIIDRIGCLGTFFSLSHLIVMGGSFVPLGGHNPIEPALSKRAVVWGPFMNNFKDIAHTLLQHGACVVDSPEHLYDQIVHLLTHSAERDSRAEQLYTYLIKLQHTQRRLITETLAPFRGSMR
jgi:3-deoxy-D-manno-octulosonic-acid transferase